MEAAPAVEPAPLRAGQPEFAWSLSRHDSFMTCKRRYYYSYYAAYEDPEIQRLKKLSALPMWGGTIVHDTLERVLREFERLPSGTEQEAIVKAAVHEHMLRDFKGSEQGAPGFRLFEHEYGQEIATEDKKLVVTIVVRSLKNAFRSPTLQEAFELGRERFLTVEDLVSFELGETSVRLRMDLAFRDRHGRVVIVDWKTGRGEGRFNETQLAGYALYAQRAGWVASAEELRTELAYLAIPKYVRRQVDAKTLEHARRFIDKSAANMRAALADPAANHARLEDFPMIERPQVCRRCNFRRLCFPREA